MTALLPITLPATNGQAHPHRRWQVDPTAVRAACALLELRRPVRIRYSAGQWTVGCHRWRGGEHHITLSGYAAVEGASATLWHELAHAHQVERWADEQLPEYLPGGRYATAAPALRAAPWDAAAHCFHGHAYRPGKAVHEREAEDLAAAYGSDYPLCHLRGTPPPAWPAELGGVPMAANTAACPDCGADITASNMARHRRRHQAVGQRATAPTPAAEPAAEAATETTPEQPAEPPAVPVASEDTAATLAALEATMAEHRAGYDAYVAARTELKGDPANPEWEQGLVEQHRPAYKAYKAAYSQHLALRKALGLVPARAAKGEGGSTAKARTAPRYGCGVCGRSLPAERMVYSAHTGARYCADNLLACLARGRKLRRRQQAEAGV